MDIMDESSASSVLTYHCLCTQLILASAKPLEGNAQRGREGLDHAYIVQLTSLEDVLSEGGEANNETLTPPTNGSVILNTIVDRKPIVIRRSDGFEPRYLRHCVRCDIIVGYHLDNTQAEASPQSGRNDKTIFIIPDSLTSTGEMISPQTSTPNEH